MILRRLYLYVVSAAALTLLATGLTLLGGTILLFVFNDPSADSSRGQLAVFTATSGSRAVSRCATHSNARRPCDASISTGLAS